MEEPNYDKMNGIRCGSQEKTTFVVSVALLNELRGGSVGMEDAS